MSGDRAGTRPGRSRRNDARRRTMNRRLFLAGMGGAIPAARAQSQAGTPEAAAEMAADLVIVGGSTGGCAAALAAARRGLRVVLTEETDWIGGQLTSQAVPPDESKNPWIEAFTGTRTYRDFRARVREYYRRNYPLTAAARAQWNLNPGNGRVGGLCCEPRVCLAALEEMFAPHTSGGWITVLTGCKPLAADTDGDRVRAVTVRASDTGRQVVLQAPYFLDATECGDLLPL